MTAKKSFWTEPETIRDAVARNKSIRQTLYDLGIVPNNTVVQKFKAVCVEYEIPLEFPNRFKSSNKMSDAEIFVENSPYVNNGGELKRRALASGYIENKCKFCGQLPEWNGLPLMLQLDHINGKSNDNRPVNLRMLCPNCHTQTETFSGRTRGGPPTCKRGHELVGDNIYTGTGGRRWCKICTAQRYQDRKSS